MAFARYKGEAEKALSAAGFPRVYIFRPAYIYPVEPRKEPNFSYRLLRAIYPAFRVLFPNQVIRADDLARAMVDVAVRGTGEGRTLVLENRDIRRLGPFEEPRCHAVHVVVTAGAWRSTLWRSLQCWVHGDGYSAYGSAFSQGLREVQRPESQLLHWRYEPRWFMYRMLHEP